MIDLAKMLVLLGVVLVVMGGLVWFFAKLTGGRGVLLPGDIVYRRDGFTFYFPIVTCLLLSALLTLILYVLSILRR